MKYPQHRSARFSLLVTGSLAVAHAGAQDADTTVTDGKKVELEQVLVVTQRADRVSTGATNLNLDIKDTPQSISVVSNEEMEQFGAHNLDDALRLATGIQVEEISTNETQFLSRGFEIKNTQLDGVGMPNNWGIVTNAVDIFGYEKLEVIRGANGLLTGVGNASGTINYVRKRPTNQEQGSFDVSYGSFGDKRVEADYSTPFTDSGTWAGRIVVAHENSDSYLRDFRTNRTFLYGVVDGQVGENGALALGYSWQKSDTSGNMWGTLTFVADNGSQLNFDRNASTTQNWTYWNTTTQNGFVEYTYQLARGWQVKASYNLRLEDSDSQLFMAYSATGLNPVTGTGLVGWAYKSPYNTTSHLGDITINGKYALFGREQEVVFGASAAKSEETVWYNPTDFSGPAFGELPGFPYAGNAIPEPAWGARTFYNSLNQRLERAFGVTRVSLTSKLKAIAGFNWAQYHRDGIDETAAGFNQPKSNISPYAGLTYDITDRVLGYVNYSYIFQPQDQYNIGHVYIDPTKGTNFEVGLKADWLDRRLLTTVALFDAKQKGLETYGGVKFEAGYAFAYYTGTDVESKGVELEATGKINQYANIVVGYTRLHMDGDAGSNTYPWVPRNVANLTFSTRVPGYMPLSLGLSGRVQSQVSNTDTYSGYLIHQGGYALLNAFAGWDILPDLNVRANINNIMDKKYISSLYIASYYGAPAMYSVSLNWRF